jgi:hypothetical protein
MDRCRLHLSQSFQKLVAYIASGDPMRRSIPGGLSPPVSFCLRRWRSRDLMPSSVTAIMVL